MAKGSQGRRLGPEWRVRGEFVLRDSAPKGSASSSVAKIIVALLALAADEVFGEALHGSVGGIFAGLVGVGECLVCQGNNLSLGILSDLKA